MGLFSRRDNTDGPMLKLNGHPLVKNMPGVKLHKTANAFAVRIEMDDPESPNGESDIYVHKNCLKHMGGTYAQSVYDVQLIEQEYTVYRTVRDRALGVDVMQPLPEKVGAEGVARMMMDTRDAYSKIEPKLRRLDKSMKASPDDMVTEDYLTGMPFISANPDIGD